MLKISLKSILARRWRLLTTGLAIVLGIAFISGTAVLSDVLSRSADGLISEAYQGIDVMVRSGAAQDTAFSSQPVRPEISDSLIETIEALPQVESAAGQIQAQATMLDKKGKALPTFGPPTFVFNWIDDPELLGAIITEGRAPQGPGEAALDFETAKEFKFKVGDSVTVQLAKGAETFAVVGIGGLGEDGKQTAGSRTVLLETATLQRLLGLEGKVSYIVARGPGEADQQQLAAAVKSVVPADIQTITGDEFIAETQKNITVILNNITTLITAFGWLAVFVAVFVIYNTFSILIAQRTRELALLRAIGASRAQIMSSVVIEAGVVGLVAAALGLGLGYLLALGLRTGLAQLVTFANETPQLTVGAVVTSLLVGVLATVISALIPAYRATNVPPVAAFGETAVETSAIGLKRILSGLFLVACGITLVLLAVNDKLDSPLTWIGIGAGQLFAAVLVLGPLFAGRTASLLGSPLRVAYGTTGRIAQENAARNPKRTTATAAALTIGVGVVVIISVFAASFKGTFTEIFENQITADLVVDSGAQAGAGLPVEVIDNVAAAPGVAGVGSLRFGPMTLLNSKKAAEEQAKPLSERSVIAASSTAPVGEKSVLFGINPATFTDVIDLGNVVPSMNALSNGQALVSEKLMEDNGWKIGDNLEIFSITESKVSLKITATYDKPFSVFGENAYFVTQETLATLIPPALNVDYVIYVQASDPANTKQLSKELSAIVKVLSPVANVTDIKSYATEQIAPIDGIINVIYALLGLAIIVALVGVLNTSLLSIYERRREIGMLRAIGMTARDVRRSVRYESAIIALLGTVIGLGLGTGLAAALVSGFTDQGIKLFMPWTSLVVIAVIGAVAGVITALWPARQASRLNILDAISSV